MIVETLRGYGRARLLESATEALDAVELAGRVASQAASLAGTPLAVCTGEPTVDHAVQVLAALEAEVPLLALHPRFPAAVGRALEADARRALASRAASSLDDGRTEVPIAQLVPTSGSTGAPRAIAHSRAGIVAAAARSARALALGPDARVGLGLPLGHVSGLSALVRTALAGGCVVVPSPDEARAPLRHAVDRGLTHVSIVPTSLARELAELPRTPHALARVVVGGAACDADLVRRARAAGLPVVRTYGMTETYAMVALEPLDGDGRGEPLSGVELSIRDGRIAVRVDSLAVAVLRGGSFEPLPCDADGAFVTADLGSLSPGGALTVHGRVDDVILTGGENVHPSEVESVIEAEPGVVVACVVGVPDATWGARVVGLVEAEPWLTHAVLEAALRVRLPAFARPKDLWFGPLPRTASGKVDRAAARRLATEVAPGSGGSGGSDRQR